MFTKERSVHDTVEAFKEAVGWYQSLIGPRNVERLRERIDDLYRKAMRHGIRLAAEVATDYDKYSYHDYLVSECILGKLNVLKRRPRKNRAAAKILGASVMLVGLTDRAIIPSGQGRDVSIEIDGNMYRIPLHGDPEALKTLAGRYKAIVLLFKIGQG